MSADFLLVATRAPRNTRNEVIYGDRLLELAQPRIDAWEPEAWVLDAYDNLIDEYAFDHDLEEVGTSDAVAILRGELRRMLDGLNFNEIEERHFEGVPYWLTGGMSWGEQPTESYSGLALIADSGIFEQPFEV